MNPSSSKSSTSSGSRISAVPKAGISYALELVDVSKSFKRQTRGKSGYSTFKTSLLSLFSKRQQGTVTYTHAIKDLTLRIPRGLSVGIVGRNGSGKSTLLKLITGIYRPNTGTVDVRGRVAALIELGAGFHPDFTGRENLFLGGVMHGLTREELEARFDEIVDFADLRDVIDDPVRTYSSGMYMRLGFSLAVHTDPDILLVDEVLAVGDEAFVSKCKDKIAELRKQGKTLLLVTHDLAAVERWCDEALWIEQGEVRDRGEPRRVIDEYRSYLEHGEEDEVLETEHRERKEREESSDSSARWGSREIEIVNVELRNQTGETHALFHADDTLTVGIEYLVHEPKEDVVFGISCNRADGLVIHGSNTDIEEISLGPIGTSGRVEYSIKRLGLLEGKYSIDVAVHRADGYPYDYHKAAATFLVRSPLKQVGVIAPDSSWSLTRIEQRESKVG